jgi:hypothetical protein
MNIVFDHQAGTGASHPAPALPMRARSQRSRRVLLTAMVSLVGAVGLVGAPFKAHAEVLKKLPEKADKIEKNYAPVYDYDKDGCYATAAIGADGRLNPGLRIGGHENGHCRDAPQLNNANTYARAKCNNGWCAIMYASYFEKDQASKGGGSAGHKHEWEHVVVWVSQDKVQYVSRSTHRTWQLDARRALRFAGNHPKIVYHKDGGSTHFFRNANASDDKIENVTGHWFSPSIVGWYGYPKGFRDRLMKGNFGGAILQITDDRFGNALKAAMPARIPFNPFGPH